MPSQRIFLLRHLSQAWAIRLWELVPTLMTFIGRIPGILAVLLIACCLCFGRQKITPEFVCFFFSFFLPSTTKINSLSISSHSHSDTVTQQKKNVAV